MTEGEWDRIKKGNKNDRETSRKYKQTEVGERERRRGDRE